MTFQMSAHEKTLRKRLRDDYPYYASKCLKIRTKEGSIEPLVLNKVQLHIHERLEKQRAETGMVRAIIVKGRKQGCCHSPDMRVLTADLQWTRIADLAVGQRLVGVDEFGVGKTSHGRDNSRKFHTATLEAKVDLRKEAFELIFDNGMRLVATAEHKYLCRQRGGSLTQWREVGKTQIGDFVRVVCPPPQGPQSYEDGWFGGMLDGEGSCRKSGSPRLSVNQNDGPVLRRAKRYLDSIGVKYGEVIDARPFTYGANLGRARTKPCHRLDTQGLPDIITLVSRTRPTRFAVEGILDGHELPGKGKRIGDSTAWARLVSIKSIGEIEVVDLQTSGKTFICEGAVSHNSTYTAGRHYHRVTNRFGFRAYILTHLADATDNLFAMVEMFHKNNNPLLKPVTGASNATELAFPGLDGGFKVGTAGSANVGRSDTLQLFLGSEVSRWPKAEDHAAGILEAIPDAPGTEIILESTVNGLGNYFADTWRDAVAGKNGYIAIFVPWFWSDEYREAVQPDFDMSPDDLTYQAAHGLDLEQMAWRRLKIVKLGEWKFMQEFPATPEEAFSTSGEGSYIKPVLVAKARRTKIIVQPYIPIIVGIDPARGGRDKTGVIDRQGRKAGGNINEYWDEANVERLCSKVVLLIKRIKPKKVVIDATEGTGGALCDMLNEIGYSTKPGKGQVIVPVKFSEAALEEGLYLNRRAEMWASMLAWLESPLGVEVPDDDDLQAEICAAIWGQGATQHTRSGLLQIEAKEHIVKRLKRSPDKADALAMTFAVPIIAVKPDAPVAAPAAVDPNVNY